MESWLARAARTRGDRLALSAPSRRLTYRELERRARAVAGALSSRGIAAGDRVALALTSDQLVPALHGCLMLGAVAIPIDLRLSRQERAVRQASARLVIEEPLSGEPIPHPHEPAGGEIATLMFTSGTTAGPKPVTLSYDNWLWNALGSALALGLDPEERWLCPMPLAHVGGLSIQLRSAIYGTAVILHDRFDTEAVLAALSDPEERVTLVSLVPTMLSRLLDAGLREPPTLRRVLLGGGPMSPALLERARAAGVPVSPSFGMTETCSQVATDGVALLGSELRIADDGELLVRGRAVSAGALAPDGWLYTGDLAELDEHGRLSIIGRKADTIVTGAENVAPAEVEAVLAAHPAVVDVAVLGRADDQWGEMVVARVVVRANASGTPPSADELRAHCAARLAPFKVPKRIEFVDSLPRSVTGKLLRRELASPPPAASPRPAA
jgi:o-succinylbenzoate---CoA ligase